MDSGESIAEGLQDADALEEALNVANVLGISWPQLVEMCSSNASPDFDIRPLLTLHTSHTNPGPSFSSTTEISGTVDPRLISLPSGNAAGPSSTVADTTLSNTHTAVTSALPMHLTYASPDAQHFRAFHDIQPYYARFAIPPPPANRPPIPYNARITDIQTVLHCTKLWGHTLPICQANFNTGMFRLPWWCEMEARYGRSQDEIFNLWTYIRSSSEPGCYAMQPEYDITNPITGNIEVLGGAEISNRDLLHHIAERYPEEHRRLPYFLRRHIKNLYESDKYEIPPQYKTANDGPAKPEIILTLPSVFPDISPPHLLGGKLVADIMCKFILVAIRAHPRGVSNTRPRTPLPAVQIALTAAIWIYMLCTNDVRAFSEKVLKDLHEFHGNYLRQLIADPIQREAYFRIDDFWNNNVDQWVD